MEKILLPNRYYDKNYLVEESEGLYHLETEMDTYRTIGMWDDNGNIENIEAIDPSGGPFMEREFKFIDNKGRKITIVDFIPDGKKLLINVKIN